MIYSLIETAKANKVNVYHYLSYLLEKTPTDQMGDEELEKLMPWNPELKSEIQRRFEASLQTSGADAS